MATPTTLNYDPNLPVYAAPEDMQIPEAEIEQRSVTEYIDPALATVEGRTAGILASGAPLPELARADVARGYQARGLLSTGGAVTGGTLAAMREARAIATPDAALYGTMSMAEQKAQQDAAINQQVARLEQQQKVSSAALSGALTTHEQRGQVEIQKMTDAAQLQRVELDNLWKREIGFDQLNAQDRQSLLGVSQSLGAELTGGIERLLRDVNVENKTAAVNVLMTNYRSQMTTAASIVNLNLSWN